MDLRNELPRRAGVILRAAVPEDINFLVRLEFCDRTKGFSATPSGKTMEQYREALHQSIPSGIIVIERLSDGARVGRAALNRLERDDYEIETFVVPEYWGQGLGMLAARELVELAFRRLSALTVSATVHPENAAALKLLNRLSFVRDLHAQPNGWQRSHHVYRCMRLA